MGWAMRGHWRRRPLSGQVVGGRRAEFSKRPSEWFKTALDD